MHIVRGCGEAGFVDMGKLINALADVFTGIAVGVVIYAILVALVWWGATL